MGGKNSPWHGLRIDFEESTGRAGESAIASLGRRNKRRDEAFFMTIVGGFMCHDARPCAQPIDKKVD
jgi:hypothetical protein